MNSSTRYHTTTGHFGIGFRRGWSEWQRDLDSWASWAQSNGFACVDIGNDADQILSTPALQGLPVGSVDLAEWKGMISANPETRTAAVDRNAAYIRACAARGVSRYFVVMLPEDPSAPPRDAFGWMVDSYRRLVPVLEECGGRVVIEGWPGPGAQCCNPEGLRALFGECPSPAMGINYDPSHLIRMGIDPIRFLEEFVGRVGHVHGKDTEIFQEAVYEVGWSLPPLERESHGFGGTYWRYTLPGHGTMRWTRAFEILEAEGYDGFVSIELEDERFNGTPEGEQKGLILSRDYLAGC